MRQPRRARFCLGAPPPPVRRPPGSSEGLLRRPPRLPLLAQVAPHVEAAPSATGWYSRGGRAACAVRPSACRLGAPRASYAGRRGFLFVRRPLPVWRPRRPPRAARHAEAAPPAPSTTSSSSTACCAGRDSSSSFSVHAVEQCIDLRSPTGKNETLVKNFSFSDW